MRHIFVAEIRLAAMFRKRPDMLWFPAGRTSSVSVAFASRPSPLPFATNLKNVADEQARSGYMNEMSQQQEDNIKLTKPFIFSKLVLV